MKTNKKAEYRIQIVDVLNGKSKQMSLYDTGILDINMITDKVSGSFKNIGYVVKPKKKYLIKISNKNKYRCLSVYDSLNLNLDLDRVKDKVIRHLKKK